MSAPVELASTVRSEAAVAELAAGRVAPAPIGASGADLRPSALAGRPLRTLEVVGSGEWRATPNRALLTLTIESHALSADQSAADNAALAARVAEALTERLHGKGRLTLGNCALFVEYTHPRGREKPVVTGYRAENSITVDTAATATVGLLIDAALSSGASRIACLDYMLDDEGRARSEAIARAALDARAQAVALARSLGVRLARVLHAVSETRARGAPAREPDAPPTGPAEVVIPAIVSITYQIE